METLIVRKAEVDDIPRIVKLIKTLPPTSKPTTNTIPLLLNKNLNVTETIITNQVKSRELTLYVAVENDEIVGAVYLNHTTNYVGHFYNKAEDVHVQEALLAHITSVATEQELYSLLVKTHVKSVPLIKVLVNNGFKPLIDPESQPVDDDTVFYIKNLVPQVLSSVELVTDAEKAPILV